MNLSFRKAILIYTLIPVILIFIVLTVNNLFAIKNEAQQQIEEHMTDLAISYAGIFDGFLKPIESAAKINAILVEEGTELTDEKIYHLLELQVANNADIYGAAIAFMPDQYDAKRRLFAPYVYRHQGKLKRMDIAEVGYDYSDGDWEWWNIPVKDNQAAWTEPYFDEGAGNVLMATYSVPFFKDGKIWGVATVDIPLQEISDQINIPGVDSHEITVLSDTGKIILFPDKQEIGLSIYDVIDERFQSALRVAGELEEGTEHFKIIKSQLEELVSKMLDGQSGMINLQYFGSDGGYWSFFAPIQSVGWSFSIRVKEAEIFHSAYEHFWHTLIFFGISLILIIIAVVLVSGKLSRAFEGIIRRCQRIERLNFQPTTAQNINIDEIKQLWHTLNNMCLALDSHFSLNEETRIAESIRQQALPDRDITLKNYQIEIASNAGPENSHEIIDAMNFSLFKHTQDKPDSYVECMAYLMLDVAGTNIDATVKCGHLRAIFRSMVKQGADVRSVALQMNDYLFNDMTLDGPVQAWISTLDSDKGTVNSVSMGQLCVLHYAAKQQSVIKKPDNDYSLSMQKNIDSLNVNEFNLDPGDLLIVVSDGVMGALNEQRYQYGTERLSDLVKEFSQLPAHQIARNIQTDLQSYVGTDYDLTERSIIVIKHMQIN